MAMLNIPSQVDDPQYRYKMPRLITKKESQGPGSKTCILNMGDVAAALKRPPEYITKWFGSELGAQVSHANTKGEGERTIVRGHHDTATLQGLLDRFIEKYVCCSECRLPEVVMSVKRGGIQGRCSACGCRGELDGEHRLAAFIRRNPPGEGGRGIQAPGDGGGKPDRRAKREARSSAPLEATAEGDTSDDGAAQASGPAPAAKECAGKKTKKHGSGKVKGAEPGRGGKPVEATKPGKSAEADSGEGTQEQEGGLLRYGDAEVKALVSALKAFKSSGDVSPEHFFEELRMQQLAIVFDHKLRLYVTLEAVCGGTMNAKSVTENKQFISTVFSRAKMPPGDVLWAFDAYAHANPDCLRGFPMVLKAIYDEDWVEEHGFAEHYDAEPQVGMPGFEEAKKVAAPFLKWLQIAASDDSGSDK